VVGLGLAVNYAIMTRERKGERGKVKAIIEKE